MIMNTEYKFICKCVTQKFSYQKNSTIYKLAIYENTINVLFAFFSFFISLGILQKIRQVL